MFYETILRVGLPVFLLTIASCSAPETVPMPSTAVTDVNEVGTTRAESAEVSGSIRPSEMIISLGDKKLTMQRINWISPGVDTDNQRMIAKVANWWLETELLYAEAERRGVASEPKAKFVADMMKKEVLAKELISSVRNAVEEVSDEEILVYYEKNKDIDPLLKRSARISFSHIKTRTLEEARAAMKRIKAGEDINELAEELSIHIDAKGRGVVREYSHNMIKQLFSDEFFEAISAAEKGGLIGPVKTKDGSYEIVRHDGKTEARNLSFLMAKHKIKLKLRQVKRSEAIKFLIDALKEEDADKIVKSHLMTGVERSVDE